MEICIYPRLKVVLLSQTSTSEERVGKGSKKKKKNFFQGVGKCEETNCPLSNPQGM